MTVRILPLRASADTAANWASINPTPKLGEACVITDTNFFKWGDGTNAFSALPFAKGAVDWGGIGGTLSAQTDLQAALNAKEPTIAAGTTGQYLRGDKSWQTLDKAAVGLGNLSNSVTGTGGVVLATSPTIVTPAVTTSISISAASVARIFFTSDNAGTPKLARFEQDTSGNMIFRNETAGGQFIDAFNGVITFRNYGGGSATLFRISTTDVRAGADNTINLGTASFRWKEVFAGNATINTSDERLKDWLGGLTPSIQAPELAGSRVCTLKRCSIRIDGPPLVESISVRAGAKFQPTPTTLLL